MGKSQLEKTFLLVLKGNGMPEPVREYKFHPTRKWRFDFSYPDKKIAFEVEGGVWLGKHGGHTSGKGYTANCEKYNKATAMGWRVFRYPSCLFSHLEADYANITRSDKNK